MPVSNVSNSLKVMSSEFQNVTSFSSKEKTAR